MNNNFVLINFYNPKALGIKHVETALTFAGYNVTVVYFKSLSFTDPKAASDAEIKLLVELVREKDPIAIGLSVMASFYIETIIAVNRALKDELGLPTVWGGIYPTMFPEKCMEYADFVVRSEGEEANIELLDAMKNNTGYSEILNLVYRAEDGRVVQNELRNLLTDLDKYGMPLLGKSNKYVIDNDTIRNEDPLVGSLSYEISGSRGCPFACSYCCSSAWKHINIRKGKAVRFRSLDAEIEELIHAKSKMKKLKFIRFYDEIFPDDEGWVDEFIARYKKEINLPFEVWGHPLRTDENVMRKLRKAGLYKVVMGIQSGSPYIRRAIFNRPEKQEDILAAGKAMVNAKVPEIVYDLMVRHQFETHETLMETLQLCLDLEPSFELQIHGLNFLPGTSIVQKALDMELVTPEEMERFMYAPMKEQYDMYWRNDNCDDTMNYIYKLIYISQLPVYRKKVRKLADLSLKPNFAKVDAMYKWAMRLVRIRHIRKKLVMLGKGVF